jgi:hypothetical protein
VSELGAHMAPVFFDYASQDSIEPYVISPRQGETKGLPAGGSELPLRGDFFCLPFGGSPATAEKCIHPHGQTSSGMWILLSPTSNSGWHTLQIGMTTQVSSGRVTRTFTLLDGKYVVYDSTEIDGFATMPSWRVRRASKRFLFQARPTLCVRDNGVGIEPSIVSEGKQGHFGLRGMRDRTSRIMARLTIETSTASGTEVKLVVPVNIIYRITISGGRKLLLIKSLLERMRLTSNSIDS